MKKKMKISNKNRPNTQLKERCQAIFQKTKPKETKQTNKKKNPEKNKTALPIQEKTEKLFTLKS